MQMIALGACTTLGNNKTHKSTSRSLCRFYDLSIARNVIVEVVADSRLFSGE